MQDSSTNNQPSNTDEAEAAAMVRSPKQVSESMASMSMNLIKHHIFKNLVSIQQQRMN